MVSGGENVRVTSAIRLPSRSVGWAAGVANGKIVAVGVNVAGANTVNSSGDDGELAAGRAGSHAAKQSRARTAQSKRGKLIGTPIHSGS